MQGNWKCWEAYAGDILLGFAACSGLRDDVADLGRCAAGVQVAGKCFGGDGKTYPGNFRQGEGSTSAAALGPI